MRPLKEYIASPHLVSVSPRSTLFWRNRPTELRVEVVGFGQLACGDFSVWIYGHRVIGLLVPVGERYRITFKGPLGSDAHEGQIDPNAQPIPDPPQLPAWTGLSEPVILFSDTKRPGNARVRLPRISLPSPRVVIEALLRRANFTLILRLPRLFRRSLMRIEAPRMPLRRAIRVRPHTQVLVSLPALRLDSQRKEIVEVRRGSLR